MNNRVTAAVERALDDRQREATEEVERILAAAVRVMERVAPEPPRVSDIVAEAGSSNKAFYRYFAGKDDLILAVMERGVAIVVSYLQHQMAKEAKSARQGRPLDRGHAGAGRRPAPDQHEPRGRRADDCLDTRDSIGERPTRR